MIKTWVIVAESSRARIFSVSSKNAPLEELEDLANPSAKMHEADLTSDLPGRNFGSTGSGVKHSMEPKTTPKEQAAINFAKQLAERIEKARLQNELENLFLICPPKFLGELRTNLSGESQKMVIQSIDKNLIEKNEGEIRQHLFS